MKHKNSYFFLSIILTFCFHSCGPNSAKEQAIVSPFESIDVSHDRITFTAEEGKTFTYKTGSTIHIPAGALVDAQGNTVKGEVEIAYREFHNAADIIASGIPMTYDSAGTIQHFQTGGMFEINAYRKTVQKAQMLPTGGGNQEQLFLKEGEVIDVNLASYVNGSNYNFYQLDNNTRQWRYDGVPSTTQPNQAKLDKLEELAPLPVEPIEPQSAEEKKYVFDLVMDLKDYPELAHFEGVMWEYIGGEEGNNPTKEENRWIFQQEWQDVTLSPIKSAKGQYLMQLINGDKNVGFEVAPVLAGNNYKKAVKAFEKKHKQFEKAKKKRINEERRMATEANMLRSLRVSGFGIYNVDRIHYIQNPVICRASFQTANNAFDMEGASVFLVTGDNRVVIKFLPENRSRFFFDPESDNKIVAILPDDKMAVFDSDSFLELDHDKIHEKEYTFTLTVKEDINDMNDLNAMLQGS